MPNFEYRRRAHSVADAKGRCHQLTSVPEVRHGAAGEDISSSGCWQHAGKVPANRVAGDRRSLRRRGPVRLGRIFSG